ncbi:hypothetical protein [Ferruginibacter sp. SUN106]|uniref:hypothetical protein n=1 Tax=Ferruginibacter sp. SUN106 TaxID=2978348 RepID=UPI003D35F139
MKKNHLLIVMLLLCSGNLFANFSDTTVKGVAVVFSYSASIFPDSWRTVEINAYGKEIASAEIDRTKEVAIKALRKYPTPLLTANLKAIYFLKEMEFFKTPFGGTNSSDNLYITSDGLTHGYTNDYIEQTIHHEFSSILFRNHPEYLDTAAWNKANEPGFVYNDAAGGVGAIQNNQSSQDVDTILCKKGILTQYALSAMENDLNTLAQNLFCPNRGFWKAVEKYPRLKTKVILLISFYSRFNPAYRESYFRKFDTYGDGLL